MASGLEPGALAGEDAHQPLQRVRGLAPAFEVARLFRQPGKQVIDTLGRDRQEAPVRQDSHDRLGDTQRDDQRIYDASRGVVLPLRQEIVSGNKYRSEQQVEVGVHRGPRSTVRTTVCVLRVKRIARAYAVPRLKAQPAEDASPRRGPPPPSGWSMVRRSLVVARGAHAFAGRCRVSAALCGRAVLMIATSEGGARAAGVRPTTPAGRQKICPAKVRPRRARLRKRGLSTACLGI